MKIKNGEFETIGGEKKCEKCPKQKKGSRECGTHSYWSGAGVEVEVVRMDVVMKGEESQKERGQVRC